MSSLYEQGYTSIGCAPCTRPTRPGEDERAGRWWWEADPDRECGLHTRLAGGPRPTRATASRPPWTGCAPTSTPASWETTNGC